ncbi:MAG: ABC transporter ATP-binding protein [Muribaculaceae bacterium]|nr:ABC transporter ATP-binding protein [Muribaculaceae bacterium]
MIELIDINKSYGNLHVLKDITLTLPEHEIISITGASGAGKTTLLQIAGSLDLPDSGRIVYDGEQLSDMSDKRLSAFRNRHIGFIFQFHQLIGEFTAEENVALPAMIGGSRRGKALARAKELLDLLGMGARLGHRPSELSGGERQRVAIARALVNDPKVVFADEPTGSLDTRNRDEIREVIMRLNRELGHTFVIVTHDPEMAEMGHRIIRMADGRIVEDNLKNVKEEESLVETEIFE